MDLICLLQFSYKKSHRVMISSEDSKLRIFDGVDLTHKYKGKSLRSGRDLLSYHSLHDYLYLIKCNIVFPVEDSINYLKCMVLL